ncbi:MAG: translation initiation factor IF-2 [Hyphomicrobiaceae bacterium]|nr:translation initiation factor IF-2 [Hyphomicrobiaceae bacterium]
MTETKDSTGKQAGAAPRKTLTLQRTVESGQVRQNFSHGRTKPVIVEKKKTRKLVGQDLAPERPAAPSAPAPVATPPVVAPREPVAPRPQEPRTASQSRTLSAGEQDARARALAAARQREIEDRARLDEEARIRAATPAPAPAPVPVTPPVAQPVAAPAAASPPPATPVSSPVSPTPATTLASPTSAAPASAATDTTRSAASPAAPGPSATLVARGEPGAPAPRNDSRPGGFQRSGGYQGDRPRTPGGPSSDRSGPRPPFGRPDGPRSDGPRSDGPRPEGDRGGYRGDRPDRGPRPEGGFRSDGPRGETRGPAQPYDRTRNFGAAGGAGAASSYMPREAGRPRNIEIPRDRRPAPAAPAPGPSTEIKRPTRSAPVAKPAAADDEDVRRKRVGSGADAYAKPARPGANKPGEEGRIRGKLTINNAFDENQRQRSLASLKRKREREKLKAMGITQAREKIVREVIIPDVITIQELANRMTERGVEIIKLLMKQGQMHKITDTIDSDTAELIVTEFGHTAKRVSEADVEIGFAGVKDNDELALESRAPVVTIMGHVDHGKTSLLDAIRKTNVVSGEAGGITQHIGAYQVTSANGEKVTFIDTPGHEAFTAMRARGAKVTDIVILVVAADDGVMPQTIEAINHAKAAGVPIIVAINKIDKPQAEPMRVRTELLSHEIVVESMSGETLEVEVSALKRTGLDKLIDAIHLQSEILDLKSNPGRAAEGIVIEAKLERGRGPVGTVLVQRGTLKVGDIVVAGQAWGRVRALIDDRGANVPSAGPSVPVEILGFDSAPEAGDQFAVVENEARAREITEYRVRKRRETLGTSGAPRTLEQMMQQFKDAAGKKEFNLVIKGDVQGSVEAIIGALAKVGNDEVGARVVHAGVGQITESDIALSNASKAIIIGFNVRANTQAKQAAEQQGIELRYYNIIYDLVDDVKLAMAGLLAPTKRETFLGYATIKQVFNITKVGKVAGCIVTDGRVERGSKVRLLRDKVVIHEGTLSILKRFKDEVKDVTAGQECGMAFANYQDIREGDEIECFTVETIARTL